MKKQIRKSGPALLAAAMGLSAVIPVHAVDYEPVEALEELVDGYSEYIEEDSRYLISKEEWEARLNWVKENPSEERDLFESHYESLEESLLESYTNLGTIAQLFPDGAIAREVAFQLGRTNMNTQVTQAQLNTITRIEPMWSFGEVRNLEGLQRLSNLQWLWLVRSHVSNLSPLSDLRSLTVLAIPNSNISNIGALSGFTQRMQAVLLYNNNISDLSPLRNLRLWQTLDLGENNISDLTPLSTVRFNDMPAGSQGTNVYLPFNAISDIRPLAGQTMNSINLDFNQILDLRPLNQVTLTSTLSPIWRWTALNQQITLPEIAPETASEALNVFNIDGSRMNLEIAEVNGSRNHGSLANNRVTWNQLGTHHLNFRPAMTPANHFTGVISQRVTPTPQTPVTQTIRVMAAAVPLRSGPGTGHAAVSGGDINRGTSVVVLAQSGDWSRIQTRSRTGWVRTSRLLTTFSSQQVTTASIPLRSGPGTNHTAVSGGNAANGSSVLVYGTWGDWANIRIGDRSGWVRTARLAPAPQRIQVVNTTVPLRSGPGTNHAAVSGGNLNQNTVITVIGQSGDWSLVQTRIRTGWMRTVRLSDPAPSQRTLTAAVPLRSGPGANFATVSGGNVASGTEVVAFGTSGDWTNVRVGDRTGWVRNVRVQ